jgi:hypothetical protein
MTIDDIAILDAIRTETEKSGWKFCKCAKVIASVARSHGMNTNSLQNALVDEEDWENEVLDSIYQRIINMAKEKRLVVSQGNLGGPDFGPAHPKLTECGLTDIGLQLLNDLRH